MEKCYLLTGATGLLGRYLIRDLSQGGAGLAVVVRPSRKQTVQERVDGICRTWEQKLGIPVERPMVLEGDIREPDLGMTPADVRWVGANCTAMINNAASLTFVSTGRDAEPWRSNVDGTRNVLQLCQDVGIREFHHVSTAYVCGLREGICREDELDVGQEFGNDYERSKVQSEQMVRKADFIDPPTIYRPAIIIGDSNDGFTTQFHGFYAALQLVNTVRKHHGPNETGLARAHTARLNLCGYERKNLVPVDWVSEIMTRVILDSEHHHKTYHLTPMHSVPVRLFREVLQAANQFYDTMFIGSDHKIENPNELEQFFYNHIKVYDSYWRNDPTFDRTNTEQAFPDLPCPHVDFDLLMKLSHKAAEIGFSWKDPKPKVESEVAS